MNTRSVYFRLISWYTLLVMGVCLSFGAYTYAGLWHYLEESLENALTRRAALIGTSVLERMGNKGAAYVESEIERIFAPEANNRFIRITEGSKGMLYLTGMPKDKSFNPEDIPPLQPPIKEITKYSYDIAQGQQLVVMALPYQSKNGKRFIIEMGNTTETIYYTLYGLLLTLLIGLPAVLLFAAIGGYMLIKKALQPVEQMRLAAEEITLHNLRGRLPVVATGDNIEELAHTLNRMISRLEESYQQASKFSADASHELRTPLSIMRMGLESVMMSPALPFDLKERLGSILEETERLSQIAQELLIISRLDAGEACMKSEALDLAALVRSTAEEIVILTNEKHIRLICEAREPLYVDGDTARLKQVMVNLLDNAIKYTAEGGTISLKVSAYHHKARLEVVDTGIGISPEDMPHIFKRFYRADKARSRGGSEGAGLGLAIARSICLAHNGDISAVSVKGEGSKFTVELPLRSDKQ